jgi:hypothetical protein
MQDHGNGLLTTNKGWISSTDKVRDIQPILLPGVSNGAELHPKSWTHRPTIGGAVLWEKNLSQKNLK